MYTNVIHFNDSVPNVVTNFDLICGITMSKVRLWSNEDVLPGVFLKFHTVQRSAHSASLASKSQVVGNSLKDNYNGNYLQACSNEKLL